MEQDTARGRGLEEEGVSLAGFRDPLLPKRSKTLENRTKNVELGVETIHRSNLCTRRGRGRGVVSRFGPPFSRHASRSLPRYDLSSVGTALPLIRATRRRTASTSSFPLLSPLSIVYIYIYMREIDEEGMDAIEKFKFSNHPNEKSWIDSIVSIIREDWSKIGEKNSQRKRVSRKWVTGSKRNKMEGEVEIWEGRERSPLLLLPFSIAYPGIRFFNTSVALSPSLTVLLYFPLPRKKREKENRRRGGFLIGESEIGRPLDRTRAHLVQRFLPAFFSR